ncbi:FAD/NAD P-binding domain-containing protein [Mycena sanguinolenta]|uniref:FAD/NAD P-binding domain-containing protein n=1 Tax=Mycena sanguinolenta TaxID=230812 RepID=A0A8H6ZAY8_9AGAR|nr:FAD/NAD P-binding domain-containing protein [Mycena sanguinolenta]
MTMPVSRPTSLRLHFAIVGCGLGGLAAAYCLGRAGHSVSVFEQAPSIEDVGAGIQVSPNLSRLLIRWGLGEELRQVSVEPQSRTLRRYETGHRVGWTKRGENMNRDYGSPYYQLHRADLLDMLFKIASPYMALYLNSRVVSVDPALGELTLQSRRKFRAHVILGADGVNSLIREVIVGHPDKPIPTGDAAYRAIIPTSEMCKDPDLKPFVDHPEATAWIGPGRHIVGYCIRDRRECNLVMLHPDRGAARTEAYDVPGNVQRMRADFVGWEPRVQKLLALVSHTLIWPLFDREPLDTWVHPSGRVALLGDACHPMLPYVAQGSAMAIEDAAVLGVLFSRVTSRQQVLPLLRAYQNLRYPRTTATQLAARANQKIFHLSDGPGSSDSP